MGDTYSRLLYHFVFSTVNRLPLLTPEVWPPFIAYVGGVIRTDGGSLLAAGGMPDHVHLLVQLSTRLSVAESVRHIKGGSSRWISQCFGDRQFAWQRGYGAFTVSGSQIDRVRRYIENQERHHRSRTLYRELRGLRDPPGLERAPAWPDPRMTSGWPR